MSTLKLYDEATAYSSKYTTLMYSSSFSSAIKLLHKDLTNQLKPEDYLKESRTINGVFVGSQTNYSHNFATFSPKTY